MNSALLTIDDFSSKNTPKIVDCLKEKGIKAIFFAIGVNVERYYEEAIYAVKNGMIVGNHSYSHPAFSSLTLQECIDEIEKCELHILHIHGGRKTTWIQISIPFGHLILKST